MVGTAIVLVVVALFGLACVLPSAYGEGGFLEGGTELSGWVLLFPCIGGWSPVSWFANPLLYIALFSFWFGYYRGAAILSGLGLVCSLTVLLSMGWPDSIRFKSPVAIVYPHHSELRIGYFLWVLGPALLFVLCCFFWWETRS